MRASRGSSAASTAASRSHVGRRAPTRKRAPHPLQRKEITEVTPTQSPLKVAVVGQGYTGLPLAIRAAEVGHAVLGFDTDMQRVKQLNAGESYVDDVSNRQLCSALRDGRFTASGQSDLLAGSDVYIMCVPTPLRDGVPDLGPIEGAARAVASYMRRGCTVILESTTYPGTTEEFLMPLLESISGLTAPSNFLLGYSPERIDPGNKHWNLENTPKLVSGIDARSLRSVDSFIPPLFGKRFPCTAPEQLS